MFGDSMQKTLHEAMRHRRISLPATSFAFNKMQSHTASNISEARGIVVDMLANRDLPPNVISCLRAVATLLNQHTPLSMSSINDFGLPSVVEDPYSGEQLIVSNPKIITKKDIRQNFKDITFEDQLMSSGLLRYGSDSE